MNLRDYVTVTERRVALEKLTGVKTSFTDERYTSLEADLRMKERGLNVKDRMLSQHAEAAAIILQSYMESLDNE